MNFRGTSHLSMDDKGRLVLPSRFREVLSQYQSEKLISTKSIHDPCLQIYPMEHWLPIEESIMNLPSHSDLARWMKREVLGRAEPIEVAANGRMSIQQDLRELVGLQKQVVLLGQGKNIEVWSKPEYVKAQEAKAPDFSDPATQELLSRVQF